MSVTVEPVTVVVELPGKKGQVKLSRVVSKDKTRPVLNGVGLHVEGETLYAVATDSYALAMVPVLHSAEAGELDVLNGLILPVEAVKNWEKGQFLTVDPGANTATVAGIAYPLVFGEFPKCAELIPDGYGEDTLGAIGINPALVDNVAKGIGATKGVRLDFISPNRPVKVSALGEPVKGCRGLVMPIRLTD